LIKEFFKSLFSVKEDKKIVQVETTQENVDQQKLKEFIKEQIEHEARQIEQVIRNLVEIEYKKHREDKKKNKKKK
jgi:hypothetical protein